MSTSSDDLLYSLEPPHSAQLSIIQAKRPFNAEPPSSELAEFSLTPEDMVYARNHGPVREFNDEDYTLCIRFEPGVFDPDGSELKLSFRDLKESFPVLRVVAALQASLHLWLVCVNGLITALSVLEIDERKCPHIQVGR